MGYDEIPRLVVNHYDTRSDQQRVFDKLAGVNDPPSITYKLQAYESDGCGVWRFKVILDYVADTTFYDYSLIKNALLYLNQDTNVYIEVERMTMDVKVRSDLREVRIGETGHSVRMPGLSKIDCEIVIVEKCPVEKCQLR